jgi:hypothetical protein
MLKPIDSSRIQQYVNVSVSVLKESIWIGATVIHNERIFIWEDGSRVDEYFENWLLHEPNNLDGKENCLSVFGSTHVTSQKRKKWNDAPCNVAMSSVCEFD